MGTKTETQGQQKQHAQVAAHVVSPQIPVSSYEILPLGTPGGHIDCCTGGAAAGDAAGEAKKEEAVEEEEDDMEFDLFD